MYSKGHKATIRVDDPNSIYYQTFLSPLDEYLRNNMEFLYVKTVDDGIAWLNGHGFPGFESGKQGVKGAIAP
jgi:hypothetical protein